jgi:hypothetical protein
MIETISAAITVLSAMITPAVLVLATGSLSLTTSQRLSRSIDRTRKVSAELKNIRSGKSPSFQEEIKMLFDQLSMAAKRSMLMQRAMALLYIAMCFFISTIILIGVFEILGFAYPFITVWLAMIGCLFLFSAIICLIVESRLALKAVNREMRFTVEINNIQQQ